MKFKWRISERMPISFQAALLLFSLVILLSVVSYQMLPETTWGDNFSTLLWGVSPSSVYTKPVNTTGDQAQNSSISRPEQTLPIEAAEVANNESISVSETPSPLPSLVPVSLPSLAAVPEKFLVPLLSRQVGAGNQFMEYLSAIVMARSLNRTLCLTPFFPGPSRHTGRVVSGLAWKDRYQVSLLSRFTRVAPLEHCLDICSHTIEDKWVLKPSREPAMGKWKKYPGNKEGLNLKWDFVRWTAPEHIATSLGNRDARCVGVVGLFPGLRWRGAFLAASAFVQPARRITQLADTLQEHALGKDTRYLAVHWRFEETECNGHHVGLCFVRCNDGSVIDSGLHPDAREWRNVSCSYRGRHFAGVLLHKDDIVDAIQERARNHSVAHVYLATDGWMRGPDSVALVRKSVQALRRRGLSVVGLWKIDGVPNFADGSYFEPVKLLNQNINGAQIALVEQELCARAVSFLGSGPSTLSLAVFRTRLARRRVKQITEENASVKDSKAVDELVAATLLRDEHSAGLHCRYLRYMKRAKVNATVETYEEEAPDGWLDFEACEGRVGRGGRCEVAKCF